MMKVSTAQCNNRTRSIQGLTEFLSVSGFENEMAVQCEVTAVVFHPPELSAVPLHRH